MCEIRYNGIIMCRNLFMVKKILSIYLALKRQLRFKRLLEMLLLLNNHIIYELGVEGLQFLY